MSNQGRGYPAFFVSAGLNEMRIRLLHRVEPWLARVPLAWRLLAIQFLQFGIIGTLGLFWYLAADYAVAPSVGPYAGGFAGFLVAATMNWICNRYWTFRHLPRTPMHRQWLKFLAANAAGSIVNLTINFSLLATVPFCRAHIFIPVMAGTLGGMFLNFAASRRLVFR